MEESLSNRGDFQKIIRTKLPPRKMPEVQKEQRLIAICVLFFFLLNFPIVSIFNRDTTFLGIPLLFVYVFLLWILLIGAIAWIIEIKEKSLPDNNIDSE